MVNLTPTKFKHAHNAITVRSQQGETQESNRPEVENERRSFLGGFLGSLGIKLYVAQQANAEDSSSSSSSQMSSSRFLENLDEDRVKKVDLFQNGTVAIVEVVTPELGNRIQRVRVQLPGTKQELLRKWKVKNVNFDAHATEENTSNFIFNLLRNLAFPLILIGTILLYSRRSQSGMGGPGGPRFPLALGRSKEKFEMEPNTGITFDDVAGVEEAKQYFKEIVEFLKRPEKFTAVGA